MIYPNVTQTILSHQLPTKILIELLFESTDEGWYNCSVSNSRVEDKHHNSMKQAYPAHNNIYVKGMSKTQVNFMIINILKLLGNQEMSQQSGSISLIF